METVAAHYKKVKKVNREKVKMIGSLLNKNADGGYDYLIEKYGDDALEHIMSSNRRKNVKRRHNRA